jgi:hypothetical protein
MMSEIHLNQSTSKRSCGGCTLCCRLVPVKSLNKPGGTRCKHQRFRTGCVVHKKEGFPAECHLWSCYWLATDIDVPRPDHAHYAIDIVPDFVTAQNLGKEVSVPVIQIWCDPHYPEAHRDPKLRAWLDKMSRADGWCALVRFNEVDAMFLLPPVMSDTRQWEEVGGERMDCSGKSHRAEEIAAKLYNAGVYPE